MAKSGESLLVALLSKAGMLKPVRLAPKIAKGIRTAYQPTH